MLPDPVKMIGDVPGALKVSVLDATGASHVAVLTGTSFTPAPGTMGYPVFGDSDALFVAEPFAVPDNRAVVITDAAGVMSSRRVASWQSYGGLFKVLVLAEVSHG